jgi:hypothetical protein
MNLKLNFHISQETNLSNSVIFDRIITELKNKKYRVLSVTLDTVTFDDNPWRLRWNFDPAQVDGGVFEVHAFDDKQIVSLNYYFDFLSVLGIIILMVIGAISEKFYEAIIFIISFYTITCIIELLRQKSKARALLTHILNEDIPPFPEI